MTLRHPDRAATRVFLAVALAALAAVSAALVSQHVFGMEPCPWCVLQRVIVVAIALVAAVGALTPGITVRRIAAWLVMVLSVCGVAAALWQHFRAAASASCNLTLADRIVGTLRLDAALPDVFEARASCADAAVRLLGVPYDFWSLALFVVFVAAALRLIAARRSRPD